MAEVGVDTSTYPRAAALPVQKSPLDIAQQLGGLQVQQQQIQRNAIGIDQSKLQLMNDRFQLVSKKLMSLRNNPNLSADDIVNESQDALKEGLSSPEMHAQFVSEIPSKTAVQRKTGLQGAQLDQAYQQTLRNWIDKKHIQAEDTVAAVNHVYGAPGSSDNGQTITPTRQYLTGGPVPVGAPIQRQLPVETPVATPQGTQQLGPQTPQIPANTLPVNRGLPGQYTDNIIGSPNPQTALTANPSMPVTRDTTPISPTAVKTIPGQIMHGPQTPSGPMVSQPPMFEEGKKQLAADQDLATAKLTAVKPALQALPLLKNLRSGPGTAQWNEAVAFMKANGIISTAATNDPTAIYQEVNKKLSQYVSSSPIGQRSDAAQTLAEASSPSPKTQISPALIKLTKDAIILDRVQAARPGAFEGNDYSKYGQHRSTFPASVDERAFGLDLMEPKERKDLMDKMTKETKIVNGQRVPTTFASKRFWKSLAIVDKQGLIDTGGGQ